MRIIFFILTTFLLAFSTSEAKVAKHNIIVQNYKDIQKYQMYEPGFAQGGYKARIKQNKQEPVIAITPEDEKPAEDYNENIAAELFKKDMSPITIEILEAKNKVKLNVGQPLQVILPEEENATTQWYYGGNEFKHIKITEDYHYNGQRIININVFEAGKEQVFFDLIEENDGKINVLGSRVLNITAE